MSYVISPRLAPAQDVVSLRASIAGAAVPEFLQRSFRQLFGRLHLLGVTPAGAPFVIYHAFEPEIDAEACVPVPAIRCLTPPIGPRSSSPSDGRPSLRPPPD
jgi:hypothetical protein